MFNKDFLIQLLDQKDLIISEISIDLEHLRLDATGMMASKPQVCPVCGEMTTKIHDYRQQEVIKELKNGICAFINLKKRRYVCPKCHKRFTEDIPWLKKYQRRVKKSTT